jgi:hypothetical protein
MRNKATIAGLVLVLCLSSLSFKCGGGDDPGRIAARAADAAATSISEMIKIKRELGQSGKITPQEELALTNALLRVNTADKALVSAIKAFIATTNSNTAGGADRASLCAAFNSLTAAMSDLNTSVFGVSNSDSKQRLTRVLDILKDLSAMAAVFAKCT